jgi:molecular chaperone HtpG
MGDRATADDTVTPERHAFSAEVGRLLDLVVHSLYSDREIFLRELVTNAADATDRRRFEALTHPDLALPEGAAIRIVPDQPARTLLIADAGVGMSKEELAANLGTIARSGTRAFGQSLADAKPENRVSLIGHFGVGFYSAFMVADTVEVTSRRVGVDEAWTWASDGTGEFTLTPAIREAPGTSVVLRLRADADEFLDPGRLEAIVRRWADHITVPITIAREGQDEPANTGTALWRKPRAEVTEEAYQDLYRHLGHLFDKPWATLHWRAEGALEFYALLFIPSSRPFAPIEDTRHSKARLHVRRMFITDEAGLLPGWLRFVQGVVDTEDLPLNVSREMLQATPILARIRKALVSRVLGELKTRAKEADGYAAFWAAFGPVLKEGVWEDSEHRTEIAGLMRFRSSAVEGQTGLADYIARMKPEQEAIYVLAGDDADALSHSPQLEGYRARGVEVLLLTDPVDAFWPERLGAFEGKPIRSVTQGDTASLANLPLVGAAPEGEAADLSRLLPGLKSALGEAVADVRATDRLVESAVVLAAGAFGPDLRKQRLLRRQGRAAELAPVLELNARHALIRALATPRDKDKDVSEAAGLLLDLARVQDGDAPRDPAAFTRRVAQALAAEVEA